MDLINISPTRVNFPHWNQSGWNHCWNKYIIKNWNTFMHACKNIKCAFSALNWQFLKNSQLLLSLCMWLGSGRAGAFKRYIHCCSKIFLQMWNTNKKHLQERLSTLKWPPSFWCRASSGETSLPQSLSLTRELLAMDTTVSFIKFRH